MKKTAKFYHAGCPVCQDAENNLANYLDPERFEVKKIHLGEDKSEIGSAEAEGVKSVPALVIDGKAYHINFGADLAALK
ncbi:MAG: thioredoxin family protein [Thermodesulfobacteriota bacterium]